MCAISHQSSESDGINYTHGQQKPLEALKLFRITSVVKASGGFDPCFLFQGTLATSTHGLPTEKTADSMSLFTAERCCEDSGNISYSCLPKLTCNPDTPLTLYIAYEQPSPKIKCARLNISPYRLSLRDEADDSLIAYSRGLSTEIYFDTTLNLAAWGREIALAFPSFEAMQHFASCLRNVTIKKASLAKHPCAAFSILKSTTPPGLSTLEKCITPEVSVVDSLTGQPHGEAATLEDATSDADSPPPQEGA